MKLCLHSGEESLVGGFPCDTIRLEGVGGRDHVGAGMVTVMMLPLTSIEGFQHCRGTASERRRVKGLGRPMRWRQDIMGGAVSMRGLIML